jgi:hypothetical protein
MAVPANRNVIQKGAEKKLKHKSLCIKTTNVENKMYYYTGNNWSQRKCNRRFKEKFGSHTRKNSIDSLQKNSFTWNITHNTDSTAV